jgi:hypothetical protein
VPGVALRVEVGIQAARLTRRATASSESGVPVSLPALVTAQNSGRSARDAAWRSSQGQGRRCGGASASSAARGQNAGSAALAHTAMV